MSSTNPSSETFPEMAPLPTIQQPWDNQNTDSEEYEITTANTQDLLTAWTTEHSSYPSAKA